ncbi:MAG: sugar phosphate isomerase/epimerase [Anaeromyxobacter sp.]|nr:sugar phosphate isomerase/epimerase [Anaeromyxobacter sp.]
MKVAVSNIAWRPADDEAVAMVMHRHGADGVELAPTAYWPDPLLVPRAERRALRQKWGGLGFPVVALQALLYGFPELQLFEVESRRTMRDRLVGMLDVAVDLGATALVFGSPKNRLKGQRTWPEALAAAVPFFRDLGTEAALRGVCLCIEPNPTAYGCDFVTSAAEGRELVETVASPGFMLHLDAAGMQLAGDEPLVEIPRSISALRHFHVSSPNLGPVEPSQGSAWSQVLGALTQADYRGYVSIEMRPATDRASRLAAVAAALDALAH